MSPFVHRHGRLAAACLVASLAMGTCLAAEPAGRPVWLGTYTRGGAGGEGIYVARFDPASGRLSEPVLAAAATNPSFLAVHPSRPLLYAVAEVNDFGTGAGGSVSAFAVDEATRLLRPLGSQPSGGASPCHVTVDPTGRVALAANFGGGSVICLGIAADGGLRPVTQGTPGGFIQHVRDRAAEEGAGRRDGPYAHSVDVSPDGRFVFCCDLALDEVLVYRLDAERATLTPHGKARLAAGSGPRHFAIHPSGRFAWCVNELALTVTAFAVDPVAGTLTEIQTLSTLPADVADRKGFTTAEIAVHPTGKFLYASNRGHDSIAMYAIDGATGRLDFLGTEPIRGKTPRSFAISPEGTFLLAAGQGSGTVTVFTIDAASGRLAFTGQSVAIPAPVCVLFGR